MSACRVVPPSGRQPAPGARRRVAGLTLIEVLVAMVVLAVALLAWTRLEARVAQAERSGAIRRELAARLRSELRIQRNVRASACRTQSARRGWECTVERRCLARPPACQLEGIRVTVRAPDGRPLSGTTAVWWPLQEAPVVRTP